MKDQGSDESAAFRNALWVSRCVGRADSTPLRPTDIDGLAQYLSVRTLEAGEPLHPSAPILRACASSRKGVWSWLSPGSRAGL